MRGLGFFLCTILLGIVGCSCADAIGLKPAVLQTPETLCHCASESVPKGGIRSFDEFAAKYGSTFPNRPELEVAWRVYKAVNQCDAVVVLGRLSDTESFETKPGYCVLRTLEPWSMRLNQVFVRAATDRGAVFELVSDMPPETMDRNVDINSIKPDEREEKWIVIYNNEIQWIMDTGRYRLAYDTTKKITPEEPGYLRPTENSTPAAAAAAKPGTLQLVEITPDPKCETWNFYSACDGKAGKIVASASWGTANYQWTTLPQQIGPEGCTITLNVSEQTQPNNRIATGINLNGGGLEVDPPQATIPIGAPNQPTSGSLNVKLKPPKNPAGDYYLTIGVYWGPGFKYHYRAVPGGK